MDIINLITIIIAIVTCFFGYRLNKIIIAIMGLFIGFNLGLTYLPIIIENQTIIYIISAVIALIIGFTSYNLYLIGIFLICALAVYNICGTIGISENLQTIIGLIAGVIAGVLAVKFTRPIMIIVTSFSGASLITENVFNILKFTNPIITLIITLIIATLGMLYQFSQKKID